MSLRQSCVIMPADISRGLHQSESERSPSARPLSPTLYDCVGGAGSIRGPLHIKELSQTLATGEG